MRCLFVLYFVVVCWLCFLHPTMGRIDTMKPKYFFVMWGMVGQDKNVLEMRWGGFPFKRLWMFIFSSNVIRLLPLFSLVILVFIAWKFISGIASGACPIGIWEIFRSCWLCLVYHCCSGPCCMNIFPWCVSCVNLGLIFLHYIQNIVMKFSFVVC